MGFASSGEEKCPLTRYAGVKSADALDIVADTRSAGKVLRGRTTGSLWRPCAVIVVVRVDGSRQATGVTALEGLAAAFPSGIAPRGAKVLQGGSASAASALKGALEGVGGGSGGIDQPGAKCSAAGNAVGSKSGCAAHWRASAPRGVVESKTEPVPKACTCGGYSDPVICALAVLHNVLAGPISV